MRCSITGATVDQVKDVGATDIKATRFTGVIFATLTEEQALRLESQGCTVDKVAEVRASVIAPPTPVAGIATYTPQQLLLITGIEDLRSITTPPLYGEGFNIAVIDTGIRETHELVGGRVIYSKNYTTDPMGDGFDHGTGVCAIIVAVAPLCKVLNLKVLNNEGNGTEEEVVVAIDDCIDFQESQPEIAPHVINVSLGSEDDGDVNNILRLACRAAIENGIWVIAAGGNSGPISQTVMTPACEHYVLAVGSLRYLPSDESFIVSNWSSRGPTLEGLAKPDLVMFGEDIQMASSASDTATIAKSGTSFGAPFVSGFAVLYHEASYRRIEGPEIVPGTSIPVTLDVPVRDLIDIYQPLICIKPEGAPAGKDNDYGYGLAFGPLVLKALSPGGAATISAMIMPMMMVMMMGAMMSSFTEN